MSKNNTNKSYKVIIRIDCPYDDCDGWGEIWLYPEKKDKALVLNDDDIEGMEFECEKCNKEFWIDTLSLLLMILSMMP